MQTITLVTSETANSYAEIMKMPLSVVLGIAKHLRLKYLMQNEEWREGYEQHLKKEAYKSGKVRKQAPDIKGLLAMQSD